MTLRETCQEKTLQGSFPGQINRTAMRLHLQVLISHSPLVLELLLECLQRAGRQRKRGTGITHTKLLTIKVSCTREAPLLAAKPLLATMSQFRQSICLFCYKYLNWLLVKSLRVFLFFVVDSRILQRRGGDTTRVGSIRTRIERLPKTCSKE